jgi:hypothetical protein
MSHGLKVLDNGFTWDVVDTLKDANSLLKNSETGQ